MRAVAVAAGMRHQLLLRTFRAFHLHLRAGFGATVFHRREGASVFRPESIPAGGEQVGFEGIDDSGQADHLCLHASHGNDQ